MSTVERSLPRRTVQQAVLLGAGVALGAGSFFAEPAAALPNGLADIVNGLPWAMVGIGGKGLWALHGERQAAQRRAAQRLRQRQVEEEDASDGVVAVAGVVLGGVDVIAWGPRTGLRVRPTPQDPRPADPRVNSAVEEHLRDLRTHATAQGRSLFNGVKVDVRSITRRWRDEESCEVHLTTAGTSYYPYLAQSHSLDVALPALPGGAASLRHLWEGDRPFLWREVSRLPAPVSLGTVTVVRTSDGHLLAGVRGDTAQSGSAPGGPGSPNAPLKDWQREAERRAKGCGSVSDPRYADPAGRELLHFVAEGVDPSDVDFTGDLDVRRTSVRGVREELGDVCPEGPITPTSLHPRVTAVFFDQVRWEVVVTHLVDVDVDVETVRHQASLARDGYETDRWITFDASDPQDEDLRRLLTGTHPRYVLASNHALVALLFGLLEIHQGSVPRRGFTN